MKTQVQRTTQELLECAEALSRAVQKRELDAVEPLLARRQALLEELSQLDVSVDDEAWTQLERVREWDRISTAELAGQRDGVGADLQKIRSARRSAANGRRGSGQSHFVSTRC